MHLSFIDRKRHEYFKKTLTDKHWPRRRPVGHIPSGNEIEHHGVEQRVFGSAGHRRKLRALHRSARRCAQGRIASYDLAARQLAVRLQTDSEGTTLTVRMFRQAQLAAHRVMHPLRVTELRCGQCRGLRQRYAGLTPGSAATTPTGLVSFSFPMSLLGDLSLSSGPHCAAG